METRKLQRTGGSSLTITLPKKWIAQNDLNDKDLLKIISPTLHTLILQPLSRNKRISRSSINYENLTDTMLKREIIARFISGVDEIIINSSRISHEQRNKIREISNFLTGFEIIDESAEKIVLRNIFDPTKFPIPKNIEKMFLTTISMFHDALQALKENDKMLGQDVISRDFEIDKLHLIITRQRHSLSLDKISQEDIGLTMSDLHYYEDVATQLERIADHGVKIARAVENSDRKFEVRSVNTSLLLEKSHDMVKKLDRILAHEILEQISAIKIETISLKVRDPEEAYVAHLVEDSSDRVRGYIKNIAEITINQSAEQENS